MNQFDATTFLALNSAAITMMGRSCFQQAEDTLMNALVPSNKEAVTEKLTRANKGIFSPLQPSLTHIHVGVIHHDGAIDLPEDNPTKLCMIRMENVDIDGEEATAVMMHNLAICWLCQGKIANAQKLLQGLLSTLNGFYNASQCPFTTFRVLALLKITAAALVCTLEMALQPEQASNLKTTLLVDLDRASKEISSSALFTCTINAASPAA
jgi:hypothetical protein